MITNNADDLVRELVAIDGPCVCASQICAHWQSEAGIILTAALQHREQEVREEAWLPIETAPKEIVVRQGRHEYGQRLLILDIYENVKIGKWWLSGSTGACNWLDDGGSPITAMYWMPLPAIPQTEGKN